MKKVLIRRKVLIWGVLIMSLHSIKFSSWLDFQKETIIKETICSGKTIGKNDNTQKII